MRLRSDEMERDGKLVFEIVTPLRAHVLCAPNKVALEERARRADANPDEP